MGVPEECHPSPAGSCLLLPEESPADVWLSVGADPWVCLRGAGSALRVSAPRACGTSLCSPAQCALPSPGSESGEAAVCVCVCACIRVCELHGPAALKSLLVSGEARRGKERFRLSLAWKRGKSSGCSRESLEARRWRCVCWCGTGWVLLSACLACGCVGGDLRYEAWKVVWFPPVSVGTAALLCWAVHHPCATLFLRAAPGCGCWVEVAAPAPWVTLGSETWQTPPGLRATDFALAQLEEVGRDHQGHQVQLPCSEQRCSDLTCPQGWGTHHLRSRSIDGPIPSSLNYSLQPSGGRSLSVGAAWRRAERPSVAHTEGGCLPWGSTGSRYDCGHARRVPLPLCHYDWTLLILRSGSAAESPF